MMGACMHALTPTKRTHTLPRPAAFTGGQEKSKETMGKKKKKAGGYAAAGKTAGGKVKRKGDVDKRAQLSSGASDDDSTFEFSDEASTQGRDRGKGKGSKAIGRGEKGDRGGGGGRRGAGMIDAVSSKLKGKDLRTAMMEWGSSSSGDEDGDDDEADEGMGEEAADLDGLKLPVTEYVEAGEETRRLAIVDMDWSRVKVCCAPVFFG